VRLTGAAPVAAGGDGGFGAPPSVDQLTGTDKTKTKNLSKGDLQDLIAARIQAGKKAHEHVAKIEMAHEAKLAKQRGEGGAPVTEKTADVSTTYTSASGQQIQLNYTAQNMHRGMGDGGKFKKDGEK
jgi:hypothetical protein